MKAGITCSRKFERVYTRLGFHCRNGRLRNRRVLLTIGGPDQVVYDSSQSGCGPGDWPDGDVVAFHDASGRVQMILPSIYLKRRLVGPDLNHLTRDCTVTLDSNQNPDPSMYDNGQWLAAVMTLLGERNWYLPRWMEQLMTREPRERFQGVPVPHGK